MINSNINNIPIIKAFDYFGQKLFIAIVAFLDTKEAQDDRAFTESRTLLLRSVFQSGSQRKNHMGKSRKNLVRKTGQNSVQMGILCHIELGKDSSVLGW